MTEDRVTQRFLMTVERAVREANREIINPMIPEVTVENILPLMVVVAKMRGQYLAHAFKLTEGGSTNLPSAGDIQRLKELREAYHEVLTVAQEMEHCVERGYLDVGAVMS